MAKQGQVTLRGRFGPGTHVRLVKVAHEGVLRSEGGELVDTGKVNAQGEVTFKALEVGSRYFVAGYVDGFLLEVRVTAREADDAVTQPAVAPDRVKLADGSFADEAPDEEKAPVGEVAPGPSQQQARGGGRRTRSTRTSPSRTRGRRMCPGTWRSARRRRPGWRRRSRPTVCLSARRTRRPICGSGRRRRMA
jgi:hypothetical protein